MCLINVIKMYRNSFTSWIGRNFLFSWDFFLLSLLPPTFVSHRVCIKEMTLFSSLFSRNLKQRKKQISIRKTDPGGKQTRKNRKKSDHIFVQRMQEEYSSKVQPTFWLPTCTKLYQREVQNSRTGLSPSTSSWKLDALCCYHCGFLNGDLVRLIIIPMTLTPCVNLPGESMQKRLCVHACMHVWPHMWGRCKWRSNVVTSLSCQVLCQRSCNRTWSVGIRNERFMYTKNNFFF